MKRQPIMAYHIGKRFEVILRRRGIRKTEFARQCSMSPQWVYEICQSRNWRASTLLLVASKLNISPAALLPEYPFDVETGKKSA